MLDFAGGICYDNEPYTPQQVAKYIAATECRGVVIQCQFEPIITDSQNKLEALVKKHDLKPEQQLQAKTSIAGQELAKLVLEHYIRADRLVKALAGDSGIFF